MTILDAIFRAVLDTSGRASLLILAVLALRPLLRTRLSARMFYGVWIAVALRFLLPFSLSAAWSPFNLAPFAAQSAARFQAASTNPIPPRVDRASPPAIPLGNRDSFLPSLTLFQALAFAWAAGTAALLLFRAFAYARFTGKLRRSRVAADPAAASMIAEALESLNGRPMEFAITSLVSAPALHGIFRPTLLFPPRLLESLTPDEVRLIVAHELAHAARRDLLTQALLRVAAVLHWFNPLAWIAFQTARRDCELACDESVVRRLDATEREPYAALLLKIVRLANGDLSPGFGLAVVESKQQIKRRIEMIIAHSSATRTATLLGCAFFAGLAGLSLTRAQPAPTVSASLTASDTAAVDPLAQTLVPLFPGGVVATIGDRMIAVDDVRREITPLLPMLQQEANSPDDLKQRIIRLQNSVIRDLISRVLMIKEFHHPAEGEGVKQIPVEYIDNQIADTLKEQFGGDRAKLLQHLRSRGLSITDYRKSVEEEIIYHYMVNQERNLTKEEKAKRALKEGQFHLRLIQLSRAAGESDAALLAKADVLLARFRNGERFEDLARELSQDARRSKGGDWGWLSPGDLRPEYEERVKDLKVGEVGAPIVVPEGCFLLFVEARR